MSAVRCEGVVIIQCCNGRSVVLHILVPTSLQYRTIVHCIVLLRDVLSITMFDEFFVDFLGRTHFLYVCLAGYFAMRDITGIRQIMVLPVSTS